MGPPVPSALQPQPRFPRGEWVHWLIVVVVLILGTCARRAGPITQPSVMSATSTPVSTTDIPSPLPVGVYRPINAPWMSDASTGRASTTTHCILHTSRGEKSWRHVTPRSLAEYAGQLPICTSLGGTMPEPGWGRWVSVW